MKIKTLELAVGLFVIAAILALFFLAFQVSGFNSFSAKNSYVVNAAFDNIGDLKPRAAVTMAGVKIGQVSKIDLDNVTYKAVVTLRLSKNAKSIPNDSAASIVTAGLLGANYVALTPGFADDYLRNGDSIVDTHPAILLEEMIGQLLFNMKKDNATTEKS